MYRKIKYGEGRECEMKQRYRNVKLRVCVLLMAVSILCGCFSKVALAEDVQQPPATETFNNENSNYVKSERIGYIYTGDSRIRRLNLTINMKKMKDTWVVCKSGMGYAWFKQYGLPEIARLMKEKTYIDRWVIISGWGVNDLWNINTYLTKYSSLMNGKWKNSDLYLLSVNPVNGRMIYKYRSIPSFNKSLVGYVEEKQEESKRISYIDTNDVMTTKGFSTIDGLHYSEKTNKLIYKTVRDVLDDIYVRINYQSMNININAERTLKILNTGKKAVWSSSDENIFSIVKTNGKNSESVTIKAKTPGTASLIATVGGKELSCQINVVDNKVMVAYFSVTGEVEAMAEYLHKRVGGDLVWIDRTKVYPYSYKKMMAAAKKELEKNARPAIDTVLADMSKYDVVYLGYPLWYEYAPRPVCTFIENNDMTGKVIRPFVMNYPEEETSSDKEDEIKNETADENAGKADKKDEQKDELSVQEIKSIIPNAVVEEPLLLDYSYAATKKIKKIIRDKYEQQ